MATPSREFHPAIEGALLDLLTKEPFRVRFFEAVRLLRLLLPHRGSIGDFVRPADEVVRFSAHASLGFPASEIQSIEWTEQPSEAPQLPLETSVKTPVRMAVNFMGLWGSQGVLPAPYVELIIERAKNKDNGFRDFLDIFNHRMISLFYRAWEKYHYFVEYERKEKDPITLLLLSFIGLGTKGLTRRQLSESASDEALTFDQALIFYGGILAQHPRSASGLQQILEDYFQVKVEVEQFHGKWVKLPVSNRTQFDDTESASLRLGGGAVVGDEIWDQQSSMRIVVGPLTQDQYLDFLPMPSATAYQSLKSLLRFYSNDEIDFEVQLILKREETPESQLKGDEDNLLLGWMTWIKNAPIGRDPRDTVLQM